MTTSSTSTASSKIERILIIRPGSARQRPPLTSAGSISGAGFYFDGLIDEVALYDRALDRWTEIQAHYDAGLAGEDYCVGCCLPFVPFPDDTISLWELDETDWPRTYVDSFDGNDGTGSCQSHRSLHPRQSQWGPGSSTARIPD